MIETKEQYDEYNISGDMDYSSIDWAILWANDIRPTIEALRKVAMAGRLLARDMPRAEIEIARESWGNTNANLVLLRHSALSEALIALPDWIVT
jgi:hypothetical protein